MVEKDLMLALACYFPLSVKKPRVKGVPGVMEKGIKGNQPAMGIRLALGNRPALGNHPALQIQWCMSFTEKMVVSKISAKAMHTFRAMQVI